MTMCHFYALYAKNDCVALGASDCIIPSDSDRATLSHNDCEMLSTSDFTSLRYSDDVVPKVSLCTPLEQLIV